jgi:hypothetical protein
VKSIVKGHSYIVNNYPYDGKTVNLNTQSLNFVKKIGERFPGNEYPEQDGTNCQEIIRVLIDRCNYLYNQIPCPETERIVDRLRMDLLDFETRAARIKGVPFPACYILIPIEEIEPCKICGHIYHHSHTGEEK